jgi:filamentous hemagglutinin family protein
MEDERITPSILHAVQKDSPLRRHPPVLAMLLATTALASSTNIAFAQSLPTGASVAAGAVSVAQPSPTQLQIRQTSGSAVVNWQSFSVGQGYSVDIIQPSATSALLNRVTGDTPSTIAGSITANGQIYLVNPNGIAITSNGVVNVGGAFVASTLGISDASFMAGNRTFSGTGASAGVSNEGAITVGRGGYAALIGGTVSNGGQISVPMGKVALGSGESATLDFSGDGFLQVAVPTKSGSTAALIQNSGSIKANGGSIIIAAATAREAARNAVNISGLVQAKSINGKNGSIVIGGGAGGAVKVSGKVLATSRRGTGGSIKVTGQSIKLASATLDASGAQGGGTINIGGGFQGAGPLPQADTVSIDAATTISADATQAGNGGTIIVWSNINTAFAGTIKARGGAQFGNGGNVEVSGKSLLAYTGFTDLSAAHGSFGNLLLDPYDVTISSAADANSSSFTATANDSVINTTTLETALAAANVTISTGSGGTQAGNITVGSALAWTAATTLTMNAANDITVNAPITFGGATGAGLTLNATNAITINAPVNVNGAGAVSLNYSTTTPGLLSFGLTGAGFSGSLNFKNADGTAATAPVTGQTLS